MDVECRFLENTWKVLKHTPGNWKLQRKWRNNVRIFPWNAFCIVGKLLNTWLVFSLNARLILLCCERCSAHKERFSRVRTYHEFRRAERQLHSQRKETCENQQVCEPKKYREQSRHVQKSTWWSHILPHAHLAETMRKIRLSTRRPALLLIVIINPNWILWSCPQIACYWNISCFLRLLLLEFQTECYCPAPWDRTLLNEFWNVFVPCSPHSR